VVLSVQETAAGCQRHRRGVQVVAQAAHRSDPPSVKLNVGLNHGTHMSESVGLDQGDENATVGA